MNMERCGSILERKKLNDLLKVIGINTTDERVIHRITCDSKQANENDLFIALEGSKVSGYAYAEEAASQGAVIICEHEDERYYHVEDCREAYALLLHAFYGQPCLNLTMIGITGTNGKSTVAALIKDMLTTMGKPCCVIGTSGIEIGQEVRETNNTTPQSELLVTTLHECIEKGIDTVIMEVSSMALQQKRIAGCLYDMMVYTNIAQDHIEDHGSLENYIACKRMAMQLIKPQGVMIYNQDDPVLVEFAQNCRHFKLSYGMSSNHFQLRDLDCDKSGSSFLLNGKRLRIPLRSEVNVYNCAAAMVVGFVMDLSWEKVILWSKVAKGAPGRFELVHQNPDIYIDYAHTEKAMEKALQFYASIVEHDLIVIFGCGGNRDHEKRAMMGEIACRYAHRVLLTSDNPRDEDPLQIIEEIQSGCDGKEEVVPVRYKAIKKAVNTAKKNDIIVVVGRGNEKYQTIKNTKQIMNDKQMVLAILKGEDD